MSGGKRVAEILVHTLNGDTVVMSSKVDAYKKVMTLAAPLREMDPSLLSRLCPDYVFDVDLVRGACLRQKERMLDTSDPCFSLMRMRAVMDLPVWTVKEKFAVWFKGNHNAGDWTHSLLDFKAPESSGWTRDSDYRGRMNLLLAVEQWNDFQRILKGEAFASCMSPLRALWESGERYMERYHNTFIQYHLETLIRDYFHELCTTKGRICESTIPHQPLGGQKESVELLSGMVEELVKAVRDDTWERAPHERFYQPSSTYSNIENKPGYSKPKGDESELVLEVKPPSCHKEGLCVWHLAGALRLTNHLGMSYTCAINVVHKALSTIPLSTARMLVKDKDFMGVCPSSDLQAKVVAAVEENRTLFRK